MKVWTVTQCDEDGPLTKLDIQSLIHAQQKRFSKENLGGGIKIVGIALYDITGFPANNKIRCQDGVVDVYLDFTFQALEVLDSEELVAAVNRHAQVEIPKLFGLIEIDGFDSSRFVDLYLDSLSESLKCVEPKQEPPI